MVDVPHILKKITSNSSMYIVATVLKIVQIDLYLRTTESSLEPILRFSNLQLCTTPAL
jgi:hypothetical protein